MILYKMAKFGDMARKTRKFGEISGIVARKAGLGSAAKQVQKKASKLADLIEDVPKALEAMQKAEAKAL